MAQQLLYCAGCNASFKAKSYDPNKTYPCPKCKQPLKPKGEADTSAGGVTLDTQGRARTDESTDPLVGTTIACYKIVKKLGQGGMGSVYEAEHLELGRAVALKVLSPKLAAEDPDSVERFKREARAAALLEHPNVVTTYAVGSDGDHHFIELQLIDGESLHARVEREKGLPVAEATRIILGAAKALGAGHERNIVHRDIKPGNIMLTRKGAVKVMDFGLAKDVTSSAQLTVSGHIMGTPHYMSPEQCDGLQLDGRADIYSLGATYYAILAGQTPYHGTSLLGILRQQADAPIPDVREKRPDVPERVQQVIEKAMAKKPEDRFQTAEELAAALAQVQSSASDDVPATATPAPKTTGPAGGEAGEAALADVMDADEERERHLHTARIRGRIKEVEAFISVWKELAKAAAVARKSGQAGEKEESEFAKLRDTIRKQYAGILKRLGNPGSPGQRVISACDTGVTLTSIVQMADADYQDLSYHIQAGAKLLYDYKEFLEEGRQDLLRQSTWYFYWDKYMHTKAAAAAATLLGLAIAGGIGWKATQWWGRRPKPQPNEVASAPSSSSSITDNPQPTTGSSPAPRTSLPASFINPIDGSEMVLIPAGEFTMGSEDGSRRERPVHRVPLAGYYIAKYEITNRQFKKLVDAKPEWRRGKVKSRLADRQYLECWASDTYPGDKADHPVVSVSWFAAKAYCEWAGGDLPSEAEWEKAARGSDGRVYPWGYQWDRTRCNCCDYWARRDFPDIDGLNQWLHEDSRRSAPKTTPVGSFPSGATHEGLMDMAGNVCEWTRSIKKPYPYQSHDGREDSQDVESDRVVKSCSWNSYGGWCRASHCLSYTPETCHRYLGLRLCMSVVQAKLLIERARVEKPKPAVPRLSALPSSPPTSFTNPKDGSEMIYVPAGTFKMGGDEKEERPVHDVHVEAFYIAKYEITNQAVQGVRGREHGLAERQGEERIGG